MSDRLSLTLYADSDGYITYECPFCGSAFKLKAADIDDEEFPIQELFCPYCGLTDSPERFLSAEAMGALETLAHNYVAQMLNQQFGKMARDINRKKGLISMKFKPIDMEPEKDVCDEDTPETVFHCAACDKKVKIQSSTGLAKAFCPYCGVDL